MNRSTLNKLVYAIALTACTGTSLAAGISREVRESAQIDDFRQDGGYLELGVGIQVDSDNDNSDLDVSVTIDYGYQWKGLFIDVNEDDFLTFGYNLKNTEHWSFDVLAGVENRDLANKGYSSLSSSFTAGVRATGFYENNIFQFEIRNDASDKHGGYHASALAGKSWQIRNVNTHAVLGVYHSSNKLTQFHWKNDSLGSSTEFTAEAGITYPISEKLVFRGKVNYLHRPESITQNLFIHDEDSDLLSGSLSLSYVF